MALGLFRTNSGTGVLLVTNLNRWIEVTPERAIWSMHALVTLFTASRAAQEAVALVFRSGHWYGTYSQLRVFSQSLYNREPFTI